MPNLTLVHFDMDMWDAYGESYEVLNEEELEQVKSYIGNDIYFGEISGKHSDVERTLEKSMMDIVTTDQDEIEVFRKLFKSYSIGAFSVLGTILDQIEDAEL